MPKTLIGKGTVITMDKGRRIIKEGGVLVDGDRISWVGKWADLSPEARRGAEKVIDASGKVIMPGLIDCHLHHVQSLSRGLADDIDLIGWIYDRIFPYEVILTEEDTYISAMMSCVEMIRTGTTCVADPGGYRMDNVGKAWQEAGMRGILSWAGIDQWSSDRPVPDGLPGKLSTEATIREERGLVERWHRKAGGRIRVSYSIRIEPNCTEALMRQIHDLAQKDDLLIQMHAAVNEDQVAWVKKRMGKTTIEWMNSLGILDDRWLLTHMACLTDREVDILKERDVRICHNPGASIHGSYGAVSRGKFPELIEKGVTVVLGCDSTAANNSLDMFRTLYEVATVHKEARMIPDLISPEKALEMATVDAARALRWGDEIGSLEVGKKADIIVVDSSRTNWVPLHDFSIVPTLVYSGEGRDVETVLIDGKVVMEERRFKTLDEAEVCRRAQALGEALLKRLPYRLKSRWPIL